MSYLFKLPVEGVGTIDVEAFGSYLLRLSHHHAFPAAPFIRSCMRIYNHKTESKVWIEGPLYFHTYVRPNSTTENLLKVFEYLTGINHLRATTLISLKNLPRMVEEMTYCPKWCPDCMREWEETNRPTYFKLIWSFEKIRACHVHSTSLISRCASCNALQDFPGRKVPPVPFRCPKCGSPLSLRPRYLGHIPSWKADGADMFKLVEFIVENPDFEFSTDGADKIIRMASEKYKDPDNRIYQGLIRLCYEAPASFVKKEKHLSLIASRKLSILLGMPLLDVLLGVDRGGYLDLYSNWIESVPPPFRNQRPCIPRDKNEVLKIVNEYISAASTPPSVAQVAKQASVSGGYLSHHFPELSKSIVEKRKKWKSERMIEMKTWARQEAMEYFLGQQKEIFGNSRKRAYKVLYKKTGLPRNLLQMGINQVYEELFLGKEASASS